MAGNLGLKTVAEGIETPAQLAALKALNCYGGQGYLFARPMTFEDIAEYFREISLPAIPKPQFDDVPILSTVQ
jgi:EAL domain-containing protein (putative c-di-GMP-specific phosphodiesterase class I)